MVVPRLVPDVLQAHNQVTQDSGDTIVGNNHYWHMQTIATVESNGQIYGYTHSWDTDNRVFGTGYHGVVGVTVLDGNHNLLYFTSPQRYGVCGGWDFTGPHDRQDPLQGQMDQAKVPQIATIQISLGIAPGSTFVQTLENALVGALEKNVLSVLQWMENELGMVIKWFETAL